MITLLCGARYITSCDLMAYTDWSVIISRGVMGVLASGARDQT
jgi:hypothetical protein